MKLLPLLMLFLLPSVLLLSASVAKADQYGDFIYITNGNNVTITGYTGTNGNLTIPSAIPIVIFGPPPMLVIEQVTGIGEWAFYSTSVTNVTIPDSVVNIADGAFFDCESLTNVTIGNSVTNIGNWAFAFCSRLTSLKFRGNAPSLGGSNVLYGNLAANYYLPGATNWGSTFDGNPTVLWNPPVPFNYTTNDGTITITTFTGFGGAVDIPDTINFLPVTSIGDWAFQYCGPLTSVTIPDSVSSIGSQTFAGCNALTSVTMGNGVNSIGYEAFQGDGLLSITIPDSVTNIGNSTFQYCYSLTSVVIGSGLTTIGQSVFFYCDSLTNVTIGNNVNTIGSQAFETCGLTSITIPDSVTTIGNNAFAACANLTSVSIGNSVTNIGQDAFNICTSLRNVTIPNNVNIIGMQAFMNCDSLTNIAIGNSVSGIGYHAFNYCASLTGITVDLRNPFFSSTNGVLFDENQTKLVDYPDGLTGSYTIPNTVTNIGDSAFESANLTSVTIPESVIRIGDSAFYSCTNLTTITIPGSVINFGDWTFGACTSLNSVTIANGVTTIGQSMFYYCLNLTNVTIPKSVTSIGDIAFYDCLSLEGLYFNGNAPLLLGNFVFIGANDATIYYLPGATGWGSTFGGLTTALIFLSNPIIVINDPSVDMLTNGFTFTILWATNTAVTVEACTNLSNHIWQPIQTNTLIGGSSHFNDSQWPNYPGRYYRLSSQ